MLESLLIKNYRLFKELQINSLKRVNLIIGKNNVEKSSLLEALITYLKRDDAFWQIYTYLRLRDEWTDFEPQNILASLEALHYNGESPNFDGIYIGSGDTKFFVFWSEPQKKYKELDIVVQKDSNEKKIIPFSSFKTYMRSCPSVPEHNMVSASLIYENINRLAVIWGKIALTDKETYVIEALQIIDKNIEKINFIDESETNKKIIKIIVKLKNKPQPVSLKSMGDGLYRILRTITAWFGDHLPFFREAVFIRR